MFPPTVTHINDRKIFWTDDFGTTHSCQRAEVEPGLFLVWTDCQKDVPANAAHFEEPGELVTCSECLSSREGQ
jgi:hypothetical protein